MKQVYLRHITCGIINPASRDGHENSKAMAICRYTPSSVFLEAMELAEVQANHTLSSGGSPLICGLDQITL